MMRGEKKQLKLERVRSHVVLTLDIKQAFVNAKGNSMSKLKKLQEKFDRVLIKYEKNKCDILLVDGLRIFSGTSKCHEGDNFNRKLGRTIALGRAEFAFEAHSGNKTSRNGQKLDKTGEVHEFHGVIEFESQDLVDQCINNFVKKNTDK